ncbi:Aldolase-type TIM barrel [Penicillium daleae]|uniref:Aldolase-type TIM barrel n=1 Tax=Penicillium daleae TaxID=63821 RepID=A0AAD6G043_9EURO|nr:Aldolase-type TIM barrel [Penicillium daleae]KAJ5443742.1 Aldolase-type TIM barrel [Penicillium daleae]
MASKGLPERLLKRWFPHTTTPFIANAPMFGFADCRLAGAVTTAGGLGFIGGGFDFGPESTQLANLDATLTKAHAELGSIASIQTLPIGIGFITFTPTGFEDHAVAILEKHRVAAVWLSFPKSDADHQPLIKAIHKVQSKSHWDVKIFVQVGTVQSAKVALEQGVDVLVVQGVDAGGHQWAQGASLMSLLPEVRDLVSKSARVDDVAILAAGGIVDGRGCVAALGLGADGIVMGTRFIATSECPAPLSMKESIIAATDGGVSTVKTTKHDVFQSTDVFPRQYDGRAIIGISYNEFESGASDEGIIQRYNEAREKGDDHRRTVWAGTGVGVIDKIVSVEELVRSIQQEAKLAVARAMEMI